jgi:hypothetical protein
MVADKQKNMKKRIVFLICFLGTISPVLFAQVQIQPILPSAGLIQKNQLWNLLLVNGSGASLEGRLELVLLDRTTSQELMTASTGSFTLNKGSNAVNTNQLNPILYNYMGIEPDRNINNLLPIGMYTVCYNFVRNPDSDKREILAEECTPFDVEPLSPPLLIFPADSTVFETAPTQFSWTPPTPLALLPKLRYRVLITEIQTSQQPAEAVQDNIPFYSAEQAPNNFIHYTGAQPAFSIDKWYAWQVMASDGDKYAGKSEVWVFKVSKPTPVQDIINATAYLQLQKNSAGKAIAPNGILRFSYFNQLADTTASVTITDMTAGHKRTAASFLIKMGRGQNNMQQEISRYMKPEEGHVYMLSLENSAGEKWLILFEVKFY